MKRLWLKICVVLLVVVGVLFATGGASSELIAHQQSVEDTGDGVASAEIKGRYIPS